MTRKAILRTLLNPRDVRENDRCIAVTTDAIIHRPRSRLFYHIQLLDIAVTLLAGDVFIDVNAVVEICEVWDLVDSFPRHQFTFVIILSQADDVRHVLPRDGVAVHAGG
ncbi:MAG: hypothetical protein WCX28_07820, partial [Bacteriovoracaceae bacterium]